MVLSDAMEECHSPGGQWDVRASEPGWTADPPSDHSVSMYVHVGSEYESMGTGGSVPIDGRSRTRWWVSKMSHQAVAE